MPDSSRTRRMGAIALVGGLLLAGCGLPSLSRVPAASPSPAHVSLGAPTGVGNSPVPISSQAPTGQCRNATGSLRPAGPLPAPGSFPSGTFMRTIADRGRLVVGISQDTLPFGYLNPLSNQLEGFDIDLAKQVAKAIFGDADHIEYRVTAQSQRVWTLRDGTVDLVARTFEMTCDRWKQVDFSTAYFNASQRLMVSKTSNVQSIRDLAGRRVCAAYGSVSLDNVLDSPSPRPIAVAGRDWTDCLALFQQGQVEAISSDDSILMGLAAQDQSVKVVGPTITDLPYGLGVSQAHPEFVRFVNAVLEKIRSDGTWSSLHSRWLSRFGLSATPPVAVYRD